jgi:2-polyprenyl-3-methyl-5-hydroxy-6-metoxy-1,4-benzoquinol methylase
MKLCAVCGSTSIEKYSYSNHLNKFRKRLLKHLIGHSICPMVRICSKHYYDYLESKLLFSSLYKIQHCLNCGYGVYDKPINIDRLGKYYNTNYWQADGIPENQWHTDNIYLHDNRAIGQFDIIKDEIMKVSTLNILEIGAGSALFSRLLKAKMGGEVCIDVVEPGYGWKKYYDSLNINHIADYFPFHTENKYHYIHTSYWLEHASDMSDTIFKLKDLLTKNGLLFIEVPNCTPDYYKMDIQDAPHIHFFTNKSLELLLKKYGFYLSVNLDFQLKTYIALIPN